MGPSCLSAALVVACPRGSGVLDVVLYVNPAGGGIGSVGCKRMPAWDFHLGCLGDVAIASGVSECPCANPTSIPAAPPRFTSSPIPSKPTKVWLGVGASITDGSVKNIRDAGATAMHQLFDPSAADSARLNIIRLPLSSTDISYSSTDPKLSSRTNWVWADPAHPPPDLMNAIGVIRDAIALNPGITVIATAWSAPAGLKSDVPDPNRPLYGGKLAAGREAAYGNLLVAQAKALIAMRVPLSRHYAWKRARQQ